MVSVYYDPAADISVVDVFRIDNAPQDGTGFYFTGIPFQRGYGTYQNGRGIGNLARTLFRILGPIFGKTGKVIGKEALATGARILDNIAQGAELKETIKNETRQGVKRAAQRIGQSGSGATPRKRAKRAPRKNTKRAVRKVPARRRSRKSLMGRRVLKDIVFQKPTTKLGFF